MVKHKMFVWKLPGKIKKRQDVPIHTTLRISSVVTVTSTQAPKRPNQCDHRCSRTAGGEFRKKGGGGVSGAGGPGPSSSRKGLVYYRGEPSLKKCLTH